MRQKSDRTPLAAEKLICDVAPGDAETILAEEKIRIVLDGPRGESSITEPCRRENVAESLYYSWSREFLEAGKRWLAGDAARAATTDEVKRSDTRRRT